MKDFSPSELKARYGILSGEPGDVSLTLLLTPFLVGRTLVDTSVRLDGIALPSAVLAELAGKTFNFPVKPAAGCIDGSVYLDGAHHPVDVTALAFHRSRTGGLTVVVKGSYAFGVEGLSGLGDTPFQVSVPVSSCAV